MLHEGVAPLAQLPDLIKPNASSRSAAMSDMRTASTLSRSSGSVLLGRTLTHQSGPATVRPSSQSCSPRPVNAAATLSITDRWSATLVLISPDAAYRLNSAARSD